MAFKYFDRVKETSTTTGTGAITLGGAASGFRTFSSVYTTADTLYYTITDQNGSNWEVGLGTYSTTLARTTVIASSNSNTAVNFTSGALYVFATVSANQFANVTNTTVGAGNLLLGTAFSGNTSTIATTTGTLTSGHYAKFDASGNIIDGGTTGTAFTRIVVQVITGSSTYTPTSGMLYCIVELQGAGGGGPSGSQAGGGAGGYCRKVFSAATIGASQTVTMFAGGSVDNGAGGHNKFGAAPLLQANGGQPWTVGASGGPASGGDINYQGGTGLPNGIGNSNCLSSPSPGAPAPNSGGGGGASSNGANGICIITEYCS